MSRTSEFLINCMTHAEWPYEGMELVMDIGEEVGYENLADELCSRAGRACDGWNVCIVEASDGRRTLCDPCPLTTLRDANSAECEGVAS